MYKTFILIAQGMYKPICHEFKYMFFFFPFFFFFSYQVTRKFVYIDGQMLNIILFHIFTHIHDSNTKCTRHFSYFY